MSSNAPVEVSFGGGVRRGVGSGSPDPQGRRGIVLMGIGVDRVTEQQAGAFVLDQLESGIGGRVTTPNLDILRICATDPEMRAAVNASDLVVADGTPLIWASRLAAMPLPERVAGSSLLFSISGLAAERAASIFLLGGNDGAADAAASRLRDEYPGLVVAGTHCPPFGFESDHDALGEMFSALADAKPDIVFVGLPFRKDLMLVPTLRTALPKAWFIGCGISFSFASGEIPRAPVWVQRAGLEWLHRLAHEPRRLAHRYLVAGPPAVFALLRGALGVRVRSRLRGRSALRGRA